MNYLIKGLLTIAIAIAGVGNALSVQVTTKGFGTANVIYVSNDQNSSLRCDVTWDDAGARYGTSSDRGGDRTTMILSRGETKSVAPGYIAENVRASCQVYEAPLDRQRRLQEEAAAKQPQIRQSQPQTLQQQPQQSTGGGQTVRTQPQYQTQQPDYQQQNLELQKKRAQEERRANAQAEADRARQIELQRMQTEERNAQIRRQAQEAKQREQQRNFNNAAAGIMGAANRIDQENERRFEREQAAWEREQQRERALTESVKRDVDREISRKRESGLTNPWK